MVKEVDLKSGQSSILSVEQDFIKTGLLFGTDKYGRLTQQDVNWVQSFYFYWCCSRLDL
jgi:hypothetical protein